MKLWIYLEIPKCLLSSCKENSRVVTKVNRYNNKTSIIGRVSEGAEGAKGEMAHISINKPAVNDNMQTIYVSLLCRSINLRQYTFL